MAGKYLLAFEKMSMKEKQGGESLKNSTAFLINYLHLFK